MSNGIAGVINTMNNAVYTMSAVQGAADAMLPAVYAVDSAVNQVASVFNGDTYQPQPYPTPYPVAPVNLTGGPKAGLIGSLLAGGVVGGVMHTQTADALRSFKTDGFGAGLGNLGKASLKSGLIGAGMMGVVSGVKNFAAVSRGEITKAAAGGNIAADTIGGILAGTSAGLTAGTASMVLSKLVPGGGLLTTIGATVAGALGATGANMLYDGAGLRDKVASGISNIFSGDSAQAYYPPQNYGYTPQ
ncbi:MAG: hypothetical protein ACO1RX_14980 [Candidatus Sericytochromatia bacterium]